MRLREIEHASITTDGDQISEVHVVARTQRRPKQIVRDVESALNATLKRRIDHRVISVVLVDDPGRPLPASAAEFAPSPEPAPPRAPSPPPASERLAPPREAVRETPRPAERHGAAESSPGRVRFISANLFVSGLRTQAQVELSWRGITRLGSATGASTRDNAERLTATAALQALQPFLAEDRALALQEVALATLGRQEVVVVTVKLLQQRQEKTLTGSCTVEHDVPQSVVYATLAAVNRVLGGLPVQEPVEYELRPAST